MPLCSVGHLGRNMASHRSWLLCTGSRAFPSQLFVLSRDCRTGSLDCLYDSRAIQVVIQADLHHLSHTRSRGTRSRCPTYSFLQPRHIARPKARMLPSLRHIFTLTIVLDAKATFRLSSIARGFPVSACITSTLRLAHPAQPLRCTPCSRNLSVRRWS